MRIEHLQPSTKNDSFHDNRPLSATEIARKKKSALCYRNCKKKKIIKQIKKILPMTTAKY